MERYYECVANSSSSEEVYAHDYRCECQLNSEQCELISRLYAGGREHYVQQLPYCQVANCCNTSSLDNLTACYELGSYNGASIYNGAYTSAPESAEPTSQPSDVPSMKESYPPPPENNGSGQDRSSSACRSIKSSLALTLLLANAMGFLSFIFK